MRSLLFFEWRCLCLLLCRENGSIVFCCCVVRVFVVRRGPPKTRDDERFAVDTASTCEFQEFFRATTRMVPYGIVPYNILFVVVGCVEIRGAFFCVE